MKGFFGEFKKFILRGNVIDLALAMRALLRGRLFFLFFLAELCGLVDGLDDQEDHECHDDEVDDRGYECTPADLDIANQSDHIA